MEYIEKKKTCSCLLAQFYNMMEIKFKTHLKAIVILSDEK